MLFGDDVDVGDVQEDRSRLRGRGARRRGARGRRHRRRDQPSEIGIKGNSHMRMPQEQWRDAGVIQKWLVGKGLAE